jgi:sorbitol/mannitol transport system substrate-binding protein
LALPVECLTGGRYEVLVKGLFAAVALEASRFPTLTTLTVLTVNNGDMIRMQKLTDDFTRPIQHQAWVTLEERAAPESDDTSPPTGASMIF